MARMNYFGDVGISPNLGESARWARLSAEGGSADAALFYGLLLHSGEGVAQNPQESLRWMRKSAALGNAEAIKNLAEPEMVAIASTMTD